MEESGQVAPDKSVETLLLISQQQQPLALSHKRLRNCQQSLKNMCQHLPPVPTVLSELHNS